MRNPTYDALLAEMGDLHDRKNSDYAEDSNPYSNFEFAAHHAGVTVSQAFDVLIGVKQARMLVLQAKRLAGGSPNFESEEDTLRDAAVYQSLKAAYEIDQAQANGQEALLTLEEALDEAYRVQETVSARLVVPDDGAAYVEVEYDDNPGLPLCDCPDCGPEDGEEPPRSDCLCVSCPGCDQCDTYGCVVETEDV